jgi:putative spermidine/putrescine transport system substrate-binding protein
MRRILAQRIGRAFAVLLSVLPALAAAQTPALKGSGEVVITAGGGTWEAAQKKAYFVPFERDTGIKVVLVPDDRAKMLTSIERGKPDADITNLSAGTIATWINRKALDKIDYKYFDKATLDGIPDVLKNEYGVGAILYAIVMAFNEKEYPAGKPRPQNWVDFYDTKKFPGPRGMAGCGDRLISGGVLEFATLASGTPRDKIYPIDFDKAYAKLLELKPNVGKWWQAGGEAPQALIDGELAMSTAFNGRIYAARQQKAQIDLSWNDALVQYDYWVVAKGSPNRDNAMKFLAYVLQARPQADFSNEMAFGPVNTKAYEFIRPELVDWLPASTSNASKVLFQNYAWWTETGSDGKTNWERATARCVATMSR